MLDRAISSVPRRQAIHGAPNPVIVVPIFSTWMPMMLNFLIFHSSGRGNGFRLLMGALLFMPAIACAGNRFPVELLGSWDMGAGPCRLPLNPDADSPIRIEGRQVLRYEDIDTARSVKRVSTMPKAWQVVATSAAAPDVVTHDLYVVDGDSLTVTNGMTVQYRRCTAPTELIGSQVRI